MKRSGTRYNLAQRLPRRKADKFNKVFNDNKKRMRSLWERKGVFYAQLDANNGKQYKYPLHEATTVPQAVTEMQALKKLQREGKLYPPGITQVMVAKEGTKECTGELKSIKEAIERYQSDRNTLQKKDPATCAREDSSLKKWVLGFGERPLSSVDAKMYKDYAIFCKEHAAQRPILRNFRGDDIKDLRALVLGLADESDPVSIWLMERLAGRIRALLACEEFPDAQEVARSRMARYLNRVCKGGCIYTAARFAAVRLRPETRRLLGRKPAEGRVPELNRLLLEDKFSPHLLRHPVKGRCSGRNIDLGIIAMNHVLDWATIEHWLPDDFRKPVWDPMAEEPAKDRLMEPEEIDRLCQAALLDQEALEMLDPRIRHLRAAQSVTGQNFHDYLRLLQWTGAREQETVRQRWSNVHWSEKNVRGYLHFPGEEAKAGGGEAAEPRDLTFSDQLEAHLREMHRRRDPGTDWIFPSDRHDGPILSFRKQLERVKKGTGIRDVTFQYFRHWFISHCVMAGIDYKTIAYWVSHRDGGVLIGRLYGHLDKAHPAKMAKKLSFHFE